MIYLDQLKDFCQFHKPNQRIIEQMNYYYLMIVLSNASLYLNQKVYILQKNIVVLGNIVHMNHCNLRQLLSNQLIF